MNRVVRLARIVAVAVVLMFCSGVAALAQSVDKDTVELIQTPAGAYVCCYDLFVYNRQRTDIRISEFRLRLLSGSGRFVEGASESPSRWSIFQFPTSVTWTSNVADADIAPNQRLDGFRICIRDTGVFRVVWETRTIDSIISTDTLALACVGGTCDEAFFYPIPSSTRSVIDIDVVSGNNLGRIVNDFHLRMLTPTAEFLTDVQPVPRGWIRNRAKPDTVAYFTVDNGLTRNGFAEGFRVAFNAPVDSVVRIEWWTTNFGELICRDTVTIRQGLAVADSVRTVKFGAGDTCCATMRLKNTHVPSSPLDAFSITITTPRATFVADTAPQGWSRRAMNQSRDSILYAVDDPLVSLMPGDSALFRGLCFDNDSASSDTIRYRWQTYRKGIPIASGTGFLICIRPITNCDLVEAQVDSTMSATQRCIALQLTNRNSRNVSINRFVARISNPGRGRTVRSATAPAGWQVQTFGGDSVVWIGGPLLSGRTLSPFTLCVSSGDSTTADPLTIAWSTSNALGTICGDTVRVNAIISLACDSVTVGEIGAPNQGNCCYRISIANRNSRNLTVDRVRLEIAGQDAIFNLADAPAPWTIGSVLFPVFALDYTGASVAPGSSTPEFTFCIDASLIPARPATIPIVWKTYAGNQLVCSDTLRLVCTGDGRSACDTIPLIAQRDSNGVGCIYEFRVVNRHEPSSPVDGVRFRITSGAAIFGDASVSGTAAGWTSIDRQPRMVTFRGSLLGAGDSAETFTIRIDSSANVPVTLETCTMIGDQVLCCSERTVQCAVSGVELASGASGFKLYENKPNPFSGRTEISYELLRPASVSIVVRDDRGVEVRRIERGREGSGGHRLLLDITELPSGVYYYSLETGEEIMTRRMLLVK